MKADQNLMKLVDMFLEVRGIIPQKDYTWSLQGPTLIPTIDGKRKLEHMKANVPLDYTLLSKSGIIIL
jgi:hypothetical protein